MSYEERTGTCLFWGLALVILAAVVEFVLATIQGM